ncbi:MAG: 50S ribosomal protein L22 [Candidatus Thorarchaeota archaeon]|nr:50S ribosomal protein L22 [Candidatus Thorarchaeota archaeon]MCK5238611.1 50S ribosomal protein L22 [Candidatus Thorarchaeota archaeon]
MPSYRYSIIGIDPDRTAISSGRNMRCSPKHCREVCNAIRGMMLDKAIELLDDVIEEKAWIPYRRHKKKRGHHSGMKKWGPGGHPVKASQHIIKLLKNAEGNADNKGLDIDRLKVVHAAAQRGRTYKAFIERAFGKSSPYFENTSHVEIVLEEVA